MCFSRERQKLFDSVVTNSGFDLDAVNGWEGEIWCGCAVGRLPVIDPLPPPPPYGCLWNQNKGMRRN